MNARRIASLAIALVALAASSLPAQTRAGHKSPELAGVLSATLPGAGSFYAGNNPHGVRHLAIAGLATLGVVAGASRCEIPFGEEDGCPALAISAVAFVGNWVWAIAVGAADARARNRSLNTAGLRVAPGLVPLPAGDGVTVGLQLVRFTF